MITTLAREEFDTVYGIMEESFPSDEYRPYEEQLALLEHDAYRIYVLRDDGQSRIQAFLAVWEFADFAFIEHLAVAPACRNGGLGAQLLQHLTGRLKHPVCLEVEPPETELAARRIGFYRRNGFYLNPYPYQQPAISRGKHAIPLQIMTSGAPVSEETFRQIRTKLYREVYRVS